MVIALDAMGGDKTPGAIVSGASIIAKKEHNILFKFYGDKNLIEPILKQHPSIQSISDIIHTTNYIRSDEKPSAALRRGKDSSMRLAIESLKEGQADAVISAGNTGALMAMSKLIIRTLPGIDRPAIASLFPNRKNKSVILDLGANIDCNSDNLVQFALMGDAFAKALLNIESPKIGLLNVGIEDNKGSETVKSAAQELRESGYKINFYGFIEGNDIAAGTVDVVVTDGFTGNIALKTAEGTAKLCSDYIKMALSSSILAKIGGLLAYASLKKTFSRLDPRLHNGAMFLGLNGIIVKSHGGSDEIAFSQAIKMTIELIKNDINKKICSEISGNTLATSEDIAITEI